MSAQWVTKVKYTRPGNSVIVYTAMRAYPVEFKNGRPVKLDQTRVIHDLVPHGCTTKSVSIRRRR